MIEQTTEALAFSAELTFYIYLHFYYIWQAEISRRTSECQGGDNPYLSPEGHNIVDVKFEDGGSFKLFGEEQPYSKIIDEISVINGVVTSGLFLNMADAAIIARKGDPEIVEFLK